MPQWNALAPKDILRFYKYSHEQLRTWYKYVQTQLSILPSSSFDVVGDIHQDITKEVKMQAELEIIVDLPTSLPLVDSDSLQVPRSKSIYEPFLVNNHLYKVFANGQFLFYLFKFFSIFY